MADDPAFCPLPCKVADVRELLQFASANQEVVVEWFNGPPADSDPAVRVHAFALGPNCELRILVSLQDLDSFTDEDYEPTTVREHTEVQDPSPPPGDVPLPNHASPARIIEVVTADTAHLPPEAHGKQTVVAYRIDATTGNVVYRSKNWMGSDSRRPAHFDVDEYCRTYREIGNSVDLDDIGYERADGSYVPASSVLRTKFFKEALTEALESLDCVHASLLTMLLANPTASKDDHDNRMRLVQEADGLLRQYKKFRRYPDVPDAEDDAADEASTPATNAQPPQLEPESAGIQANDQLPNRFGLIPATPSVESPAEAATVTLSFTGRASVTAAIVSGKPSGSIYMVVLPSGDEQDDPEAIATFQQQAPGGLDTYTARLYVDGSAEIDKA